MPLLSAIRAPGPRCDMVSVDLLVLPSSSRHTGPPTCADSPSGHQHKGSFCSGAGAFRGLQSCLVTRRHRAVRSWLSPHHARPLAGGEPPHRCWKLPQDRDNPGCFSLLSAWKKPASSGDRREAISGEASPHRGSWAGCRAAGAAAGPTLAWMLTQRALPLWGGNTHRPSAMPGHPGRTS